MHTLLGHSWVSNWPFPSMTILSTHPVPGVAALRLDDFSDDLALHEAAGFSHHFHLRRIGLEDLHFLIPCSSYALEIVARFLLCPSVSPLILDRDGCKFGRSFLHERAHTFLEIGSVRACSHQFVRLAHRVRQFDVQVFVHLLLHDHQRHGGTVVSEMLDVGFRFIQQRFVGKNTIDQPDLFRFFCTQRSGTPQQIQSSSRANQARPKSNSDRVRQSIPAVKMR